MCPSAWVASDIVEEAALLDAAALPRFNFGSSPLLRSAIVSAASSLSSAASASGDGWPVDLHVSGEITYLSAYKPLHELATIRSRHLVA